MWSRWRSQQGSAVVEFVLVAPLVMVIFAAICQIALASYVRSTLIACAAEGARVGAQFDADRGLAVRRARSAVSDSIAADTVTGIEATTDRAQGAPVVAVTITARLPLFGLLGPTSLRVTGHSLLEDGEAE
jgi:hypothetical protein